jgi:hypothetical protein
MKNKIPTLLPMMLVPAFVACQGLSAPITTTSALDLTGIEQIDLRTDNGDAVVARGSNSTMTVVKRGEAQVVEVRDGSTLRITGNQSCIGIVSVCSLNISLEVPRALKLILNTQNGDLTARGSLSFQATTGNGDLFLEGLVLPAGSQSKAVSTTGDVFITGLDAPDGAVVKGRTVNGNLQFNLPGFQLQRLRNEFTATKPGLNTANILLETINGDVKVRP